MKIFTSFKKIIGIIIPMVLLSFYSQAQIIYTSCTSKDLELVDAVVTDGSGDKDKCNTCEEGSTITRYISLAIYNKTGSTRTNFKYWADLEITDPNGNVTTRPITGCKGPVPSNSTTWLDFADPVQIPCGSKLRLINILLGWTDASKGPKNDCINLTKENISPKCGYLPAIEVRSGLIVSKKTISNGLCSVVDGKPTAASIDITPDGGTPGYTYAWTASNGGVVPSGQANNQDLSSIAYSGKYTVTISDAKNCSIYRDYTITVKQLPTLSATPVQSNCLSAGKPSDGAIDLNISGGTGASFSYLWATSGGSIPSGQVNSQDLSGIKNSGTYSVTVTDNDGCKESASYTITILQIPSISSSNVTQSSCTGSGNPSDGAINIDVTGGNPSYTYSWTTADGEIPSGQAANQDLNTIKKSGNYAVSIIDSKGCMETASFDVTILRSPTISGVSVTNSSCESGTPTLGAISITVSSGAPAYSYLWTASNGGAIPVNQSTAQNLSGITTSGSYNVVVTDVNSCTTGSIYSVTVLIPPAAPEFTILEQPSLCNATGSLSISNSGSNLEYSFNGGSWTSGSTIGGIEAGSGDTYSISVRNEYGCISQVVGICTSPATITKATNLTTAVSNAATPTTELTQQTTSPSVSSLGSATLEASLSVKATPNPFNDQVRFTINSIDYGTATLDIYNIYGQKLKTVYKGTVNPGINYFDLKLAGAQKTSELVYVFTMGTQKITGKLIQNGQ